MAAAGILGAIKVRGDNLDSLHNDRILIAGAGSAGMGVAEAIVRVMQEVLGIDEHTARAKIYMTDIHGLLGDGSKRSKEMLPNTRQRQFLKHDFEDCLSLEDAIDAVWFVILIILI